MFKLKRFGVCGGILAVFCAASVSFAQNYNFPSPLPPTGSTSGVRQIITFIWDDNAYSGKKGTNYEGPSTTSGQFTTVNWVGGLRDEGGWVTTTNKNELNIKEGDFGMGWAAYRLAGRNNPGYPKWDPLSPMLLGRGAAPYYSPNKPGGYSDTVLYNDVIYACTDWIADAATNKQAPDQSEVWTVVRPFTDKIFKTNPDGTPITMTFNVITGLIVSAFPIDWQSRESKYGYYVPNEEFYAAGTGWGSRHSKISVTWGREYAIFNDKAADAAKDYTKLFTRGYIEEVFAEALELGHEIGNHTIDHMETNSPLPHSIATPYPAAPLGSGTAYIDGFGRWNGEGMDMAKIDTVTLPDGEKLITDEAKEFGQRDGNIWQYMGWQGFAGKVLSKNAWKGLISLAETELTDAYGLSAAKGTCVAFRAPRLEVSSGLFWALKDLGYLYDCGNEEGYEYNMDGTNQLWPYTMDNGSPNVAWQRMAGENKSNFDSLPDGVWQIPVAVLIVPQKYRDEVWQNHKKIAEAEGEGLTQDDYNEWMKNGKVTGFDFNLFILYGTPKDAALETMKYSLDQRMKGGRAPFQIGCHTDYFTPIYDYATLLNDANKNTYGLVVGSNGGTPWNTWKDRIDVWEGIRDHGISNGAFFYSGKQTIEYVKTLVAQAKVGKDEKKITGVGDWEFFTYENKSVANRENFSGDIINAEITTTLKKGESEDAGYAIYGNAGEFEFDHISLTYKTTAPLTIRLITNDGFDMDYPYEITLSNLQREVQSGQIPVSAFQRNQYVGDKDQSLVGLHSQGTDFTKTITGIEIAVQTPEPSGAEFPKIAPKTTLSIKDFTLYSGEQTQGIKVGVANRQKAAVQKIAVQAMTSNALKLNLASAGIYNVDVVGINGRVVKSFRNQNLTAGLNTLSLSSIAKGIYMIRIYNKNYSVSLKSPVL